MPVVGELVLCITSCNYCYCHYLKDNIAKIVSLCVLQES